jgi:hypothetical protein
MTHFPHQVYSAEKASCLRSGLRKLLMNPAFIVSRKEFGETLDCAFKMGFYLIERKRKILSRIAVLRPHV